jgi:hypothetical protein
MYELHSLVNGKRKDLNVGDDDDDGDQNDNMCRVLFSEFNLLLNF